MPATTRRASEFERNFMSRNPKTAEATRAQVVSAALQSLARRLGDQPQARKALIFVSEGFRPAQPRAIIYAANRNGVAVYPLDPHPEATDDESMLRSIAEQTGGAASINDPDLAPALARAMADLDHYFVLSFPPSGPADGRFHPVQVRVKRPGAQARSRSGYWAPDARVAAAAAKAAAPRNALPFRASRSSPYIRPWIGMSRGPDGHDARHRHMGIGRNAAAESACRVDSGEGDRERRDGAVRRAYRRRRRRPRHVQCAARAISRSRWRFRAAAAQSSTPTIAAFRCRICR